MVDIIILERSKGGKYCHCDFRVLKNFCCLRHSVFFGFLLIELGFCCCARAFSSCGMQASHCGGFSCCRARALEPVGSAVVAHRLSCPECSMWNLPGPGIEPMSPALAGGFITNGPPGKF